MPEQDEERDSKLKRIFQEFFMGGKLITNYELPRSLNPNNYIKGSLSGCCGSKVFVPHEKHGSVVGGWSDWNAPPINSGWYLDYYLNKDGIKGFTQKTLEEVQSIPNLFNSDNPKPITFLELSMGKYKFVLAYKDT